MHHEDIQPTVVSHHSVSDSDLDFAVPQLRVLDAVFRASADTILVIDRDGRYLYVGVTSARIMGLTPEAMLGKTFQDLGVPPERCAEMARLREQVFTTGQSVSGEIPILTKAGTRDFEFILSPIQDENRDIRAVLCMGRDITARKQSEREREALYQRAVRETHHRIKNNLQLIAAMLDMSMAEHAETLPSADFRRVQQQITLLAGIHDLLTQNAISTRQLLDRISVKQLLTRLLGMLNTAVGQHQISMELDDVRLPVHQVTSLGLIVNELIGNAIKHGQGKVQISFRVEGRTARLTVEDDGPGIPPDFDLRSRANTGLDLVDTLVRHDLAGAIALTNRLAGGTQAEVTFPLPEA